jgi:hypothetical protein
VVRSKQQLYILPSTGTVDYSHTFCKAFNEASGVKICLSGLSCILKNMFLLIIFIASLLLIKAVPDDLRDAVLVADVKLVNELMLTVDSEILSSRPPVVINREDDVHGRTAIMVCGMHQLKKKNRKLIQIA